MIATTVANPEVTRRNGESLSALLSDPTYVPTASPKPTYEAPKRRTLSDALAAAKENR